MFKFPVLLYGMVFLFMDNPHDSDDGTPFGAWMPIVLKVLHAIIVVDFCVGHLRFAKLFYPPLAAIMMVAFISALLAGPGDTPVEIRAGFGFIGLGPYLIVAVVSLRQPKENPATLALKAFKI